MPKSKTAVKNIEKKPKVLGEEPEKIIEIAEGEAEVLDDELIPGEVEGEDSEDDEVLDVEEVDPFKDKWEE